MEQSLSEAGGAGSPPPKKKRGRPKKIEKPAPPQQSEANIAAAKDVHQQPEVKQKRRKGSFSQAVESVGSGRRKQQQQQQQQEGISSSPDADMASSPAMTEKLEEESRGGSAADVKVGQMVHGVVDGTFDAGYLVTVRVGDTQTVFRGVVFGPGLSLPLTRENDVAPKMKRVSREDDDTLDVAPSEGSPPDDVGTAAAAPSATVAVPVSSTTSTRTLQQASITACSIPIMPSTGEAHRASPMAATPAFRRGAASSTTGGIPPSPNSAGAAGYSASLSATPYRSPSFAQSPQLNAAAGGFYYVPPGYSFSPNSSNHGPVYHPMGPRGFPAPFHYHPSRAEFPAGSSQITGPAAAAAAAAAPAATAPAATSAASPLPSMQGTTLPPHAS